MRQIRRNTFETNSSSTHSLAVPKRTKNYSGRSIYFGLGEFGWSYYEEDSAAYLWTALRELNRQDLTDKFFEILDRNHINYTCAEVEEDSWYYVDHVCELTEFIENLFESDERTLAFIFDGLVFTGNDNDEPTGFINRNEKTISKFDWEHDSWIEEENPYYKELYEKEYDWHYKGN